MNKYIRIVSLLAALVLSSCAGASSEAASGNTLGALGSDGRISVGEHVSFLPLNGYTAEVQGSSAFLQNADNDSLFSLSIIGVNEDERVGQDVIEEFFAGFTEINRQDPVDAQLSGLPATRVDFEGILGDSILSGSTVLVDLGGDASFLAIAFANVSEDLDSWQEHAAADFTELLRSVALSPVEE